MNQKPSGSVTFLFTDIEGSTRMAQDFPDMLPASLKRHNGILSDAIESNNGSVFDVVGDAFMGAFANAEDAVRAAVLIQKNLAGEKWNDARIRTRIGIHSGNAQWSGSRYMGYITLARTARVMSAAYGEQILLSENVLQLIPDNRLLIIDEDNRDRTEITFKDLGERRLKDLINPIRLYQAIAKGLREDFPPLKTLDARPNNLPVQLTSFIGRQQEIIGVKSLLKETHLLTLTGSGGAGKTRLALQIGADVIDDFADGVWIAELASLLDPELLPQTISQALGIAEQPDVNVNDSLIEFIGIKQLLLIIDNCEHMVDKVAGLTELLLSRCRNLKIIATSREALRCNGEQTHRVLSLEYPDPNDRESPEMLTQYESVRLFIERALAVNPNFRVNNENAPALAEICSQLDGIPLALELAAARTKALSVEQIHKRLGNRFSLLTGGNRTSLPRQQTLKALIDWSYDLLTENEKLLWNRLSVFSGGWTLEAAEEVCSDEKLNKYDVIDLLTDLAEKSIVIFNEVKERFRMLETIRQYGDEMLKSSNEHELLCEKHLSFFTTLAETTDRKLKQRGKDMTQLMNLIDKEQPNIERSLIWSLDNSRLNSFLNLILAVTYYWQIRGHFSEAMKWIETALEITSESTDRTHNKLVSEYGNFMRLRGDYDIAKEYFDKSLEIAREIGDEQIESETLNRLGITAYDQGKYEQAAQYYSRNLEILSGRNDKIGIARTLNNLGNVRINQGDYESAIELYEKSLATRRETGDTLGTGITLNNLGILAYERGHYEKANEMLNESLKIREDIGDAGGVAICLENLGNVAYNRGEYDEAITFYEKSLKFSQEIGDKIGSANLFTNLGKACLEQDDKEQALKYFNDSLAVTRESQADSINAVNTYYLGRLEFANGNFEKAREHYDESISLYCSMGNKKDISLNIFRMAEFFAALCRPEDASVLLGFVEAEYFESKKVVFPKVDRIAFEKTSSQLKEELGGESFNSFFEQGKKLSPEEAVELALSR